MEILGKVHLIGETQVVGNAGTFKKRTIVIATSEQYVQYIPVDFVQDKCSDLDSYAIGDDVTVSINVRGNEYNGKYYVSLNGWKIAKNIVNEKPNPTVKEEPVNDMPF